MALPAHLQHLYRLPALPLPCRDRILTVTDCDEEEQNWKSRTDASCRRTELQRKELRASIGRGLQTLPEEYRRILVLRELGGMSYEELSAALDLDLER